MKHQIFLLSAATALLAACGSNTETEPVVVVEDTTVVNIVTDTVKVAAPIDSAAVAAFYDAAHAKAKGKHTIAHKAHAKQTTKMVKAESHEIIEHHDAMPPVASTTPAPAPAEPVVVVVHDVDKVYFRPDEKASFPGGEKAFDEYLVKNVEYPEDALNRGVEGTVYSVVSLDEQGNVTKVEFPDGRIGFGLNKEAERLLMASPRWNPAKHEGIAVKSKFTIPITFDIK